MRIICKVKLNYRKARKNMLDINTNQIKTLLNRAGLLDESIVIYKLSDYSESIIGIEVNDLFCAQKYLSDEEYAIWKRGFIISSMNNEIYRKIKEKTEENFNRILELLQILGFEWYQSGYLTTRKRITKTCSREEYENYRDDKNSIPLLMLLNNI